MAHSRLIPSVQSTPPRVVWIILDDIGPNQFSFYDDVNRYRLASPPNVYPYPYTPTLDLFAAQGVRYTQCHGAALCSPTRAMLLTGEYPRRTGVGAIISAANVSSSFTELGNPTSVATIASLLNGKRVARGKWHLALDVADGGTLEATPTHPKGLGFSSWQGTARNLTDPVPTPPASYWSFWWYGNDGTKTWVHGEYATIYLRSQISRWLSLNAGNTEPLFLYCAFNDAHDPYSYPNVPPADQHGFGGNAGAHANTTFRAKIECLDKQLAILLDDLPSDTYVFILGDNGTSQQPTNVDVGEVRYPAGHHFGPDLTGYSSAPYVATKVKKSPYEGGTLVPLLVKGPGVVPGVCDDLVDLVDLFATTAELHGVTVPVGVARDSVSLVPTFTGGAGTRTFSFSELFTPNTTDPAEYTSNSQSYIRKDGTHLWKLIRVLGQTDEFYDLSVDPMEATDLGTGHAEYAATLADLLALLAS